MIWLWFLDKKNYRGFNIEVETDDMIVAAGAAMHAFQKRALRGQRCERLMDMRILEIKHIGDEQ